jgi:hypothetical protein
MLTQFKAAPTVARFMCSTARVRFLLGPLGGGKSAACIIEAFRRSVAQEPNAQGVRPTRWAFVRNTTASLRMTTLPDILSYLGELADWRVSENTVWLRFPLADGTRVEAQWLLLPLDEPQDIKRLLSLNLTGVFLEECRELDFSLLPNIIGRTGRYPSIANGGVMPTWKGLIGASNPWPEGSDWHEGVELDAPEGWEVFRQPSGLSEEAENLENLIDGYYENLCKGSTEAWQRVYVHGLNGPDLSGQAVFADVFSFAFHVKHGLRVREGAPVLIGMDTDRNPACVLAQRGMGGGLRVLDAIYGEGIGLELFVENELKPLLYEYYASCPIVLIVDPSAVKRSSVTEESQLQALQRMGFDAMLAPTNAIEPRLRAVDEMLSKQFGGEPAVIFDSMGCADLIRALQASYRYKRDNKGQLSPAPEKKHPWSDLVDGFGYLCLGQSAAGRGQTLRVMRRANVARAKPAPPVGAWT